MPSFGGGGGQTQPATFSQGGNPAPYIPTAQGTADTNYQNLLQGLINPSMAALNNIGQLPATQAYPEAQYLSNLVTQNPYFGNAQQAIGLADQYGQAAGTQAYNTGMNIFPQMAGQLTGAGNQILNTAFDPQQTLYNNLIGEVSDRANAQNAMSGLAGTPYGANLVDDATQNFITNWQNQQLGRQTTGLGAFNQAVQGAGNLYGQGANLASTGANLIGQAGQLPYAQLNQFANQGMGALGNLVNLGNQQFTIPQDALNYLANYMRLGQGSSELAGSLGNAGFNQNQQGLSNMVGAAGLGSQALFGSAGPFGSSGLIGGLTGGAGLGGLFGGGFGGAGLGAATDAAATGAGLDALAFLPFL